MDYKLYTHILPWKYVMKALIVYDSAHGNTEQITKSIGDALASDVRLLRASEVNPSDVESLDLRIVGSLTYGGRPTPPIQYFLKKVPRPAVRAIKVDTFDIRVSMKWVKIFGFAAGKIAGRLKG